MSRGLVGGREIYIGRALITRTVRPPDEIYNPPTPTPTNILTSVRGNLSAWHGKEGERKRGEGEERKKTREGEEVSERGGGTFSSANPGRRCFELLDETRPRCFTTARDPERAIGARSVVVKHEGSG